MLKKRDKSFDMCLVNYSAVQYNYKLYERLIESPKSLCSKVAAFCDT